MANNIKHEAFKLKNLKKKKYYNKFAPAQNSSETTEETISIPDAFMRLIDYVGLCLPMISDKNFMDIKVDLVYWGDQLLFSSEAGDRTKFKETEVELLFRIKLILPTDKLDFVKPKFDEFLERLSKTF
jgi:hypothetical protein